MLLADQPTDDNKSANQSNRCELWVGQEYMSQHKSKGEQAMNDQMLAELRGILSRDATSHISLYDGRGIYHD